MVSQTISEQIEIGQQSRAIAELPQQKVQVSIFDRAMDFDTQLDLHQPSASMVPDIPDDPFCTPTRILGSAMPQIDQIMPKESVGKIIYRRPADAKSIDDFLKVDDEEE